eukprot:jgi/Undpi1/8022/HiC_scaffold_24.g10494.m1
MGPMGTTGETAKHTELRDNILGFIAGSDIDPNDTDDDEFAHDDVEDDDFDALALLSGGGEEMFDDMEDFEPTFNDL